ILQRNEGDDFVLATGETHSVREFIEAAFAHVDLDWKQFVKHDPRYERPAEVDLLLGDAAKAKKILGWEPKVRFLQLVRIMVNAFAFCGSSPRNQRMRVTIGSRPGESGRTISPVRRRSLNTAPSGALSPILFAISNRPSGVYLLPGQSPRPNLEVETG